MSPQRLTASPRRVRTQGFTNRASAFTLIELLVVIAIIAILAAILFPVFAQAREKARQSSCMANEKNLALAVLGYNQDYDETFPAQGTDWQNTWVFNSQPYMRNYDIVRCPSDSHDTASGTGPQYSYVANGAIAYGPSGWVLVGVINAGRGWFDPQSQTLAKVKRPSETILFAERHKMPAGSWMNPQMQGAFSPWATVLMGPDGVDGPGESLPGQPTTGDGTWSAPNPNSDGAIATQHNGMSNFAFADGHVKAMKPRQTVNAVNPSQANCAALGNTYFNMWDATRQ